jgi:uncharacterized membrane protein
MTLAPFFAAPTVIQVHALAATTAFALGIVQLAAPKRSLPHRLFGWLWVGLLGTVALSSFLIHTLRVWGPWSPLHLLSIFTLVMLARAVWLARRHEIKRHQRAMLGMFFGAMLVPGVIALMPGRLMHAIVFGP